VLYELGLAHAIGKPEIMVSESVEDIPFDLRALRVLDYDKNAPDWGEALKAKIVQAIGQVLAVPTESVLSVFLEVDPSLARVGVSPWKKDVLALRQEIDSLKRTLLSRPSPALTQLRRAEAFTIHVARGPVSPGDSFLVLLSNLLPFSRETQLYVVPAGVGLDGATGFGAAVAQLVVELPGSEERTVELRTPHEVGEYEVRGYDSDGGFARSAPFVVQAYILPPLPLDSPV
jgi:hypothetical protein